MRRLDSMTAGELRDAALDEVQERGDIESWRIAGRVALRLGGNLNDAASLGVRSMNDYRDAEEAKSRFTGRVRRALGKLADEGTFVKVGSRQKLPSGHSSGQFAVYFTPEAFGAARHEHAERMEAADALEKRWKSINRRLTGPSGVALDRQHRLTVDEWEQLLDAAGWY